MDTFFLFVFTPYVSVCVSEFPLVIRTLVHIGLDLIPTASFALDNLCEDPISNQGHILS